MDQAKENIHHEHREEFPPPTKVDTLHNDEALKVLATYGGEDIEWDPEEERKLVKKIDRKLVPLMFITYGLVYYDKAMISQAVSYSTSIIKKITNTDLHFNRHSLDSAKSLSSPAIDTVSHPPFSISEQSWELCQL